MSWRNCISRPFSKKIKIEHVSGSIVENFIRFVFILCQVQGYRNTPLAFTSYKAFLKNKKRSGTSLLPHFLHDY